MNIVSELRRIARSLLTIEDQDDNSILILCQPRTYQPKYITIKIGDNKYSLIKLKHVILPQKYTYYDLSCYLIRLQKKYSQKLRNDLFEFEKTVNIEELKKQLLYGQFNLDATTFQQFYNTKIDNFQYRDFIIYLLSNDFKQEDVKRFIDQIYRIVPNNLLRKYKHNIQFKNNLQDNHIAQAKHGILQITEYNIHAFIHQLGHAILQKNENNQDKIQNIINLYQKRINFPSSLSRKDIGEYFSQIFAFYFLNKQKLIQQQIDLVDYIAFDRKIIRAKIKMIRMYHGSPQQIQHNKTTQTLNKKLNKRLFAFKI